MIRQQQNHSRTLPGVFLSSCLLFFFICCPVVQLARHVTNPVLPRPRAYLLAYLVQDRVVLHSTAWNTQDRLDRPARCLAISCIRQRPFLATESHFCPKQGWQWHQFLHLIGCPNSASVHVQYLFYLSIHPPVSVSSVTRLSFDAMSHRAERPSGDMI